MTNVRLNYWVRLDTCKYFSIASKDSIECGCTNVSLVGVLEDFGSVAAYGFETCTLLAFAIRNDSSPSSSFSEQNIEHN